MVCTKWQVQTSWNVTLLWVMVVVTRHYAIEIIFWSEKMQFRKVVSFASCLKSTFFWHFIWTEWLRTGLRSEENVSQRLISAFWCNCAFRGATILSIYIIAIFLHIKSPKGPRSGKVEKILLHYREFAWLGNYFIMTRVHFFLIRLETLTGVVLTNGVWQKRDVIANI